MAVGDSLDSKTTRTASPGDRAAEGTLLAHVGAFLAAVRGASNKRRIYLLATAVTVVVGAATIGQIRLNVWQRDFYDALAQRHVDLLVDQLLVFGAIVAALVAFEVAQTWLKQTIQIGLRSAITGEVMDEWLQPRRAYLMTWAGDVGVNPDQRIQEDCRHLCELCAELGVGLMQSTLMLISFVGVLWVMSENVALVIDGGRITIPGYMVWCALAYALLGSWATWRVGRPLVALDAEHYAREADFRFALVHTNEAAEAIGLSGGEADARRDLGTQLGRALAISRRIALGLANLTWVTAGHGWLALVVPIIVAAPGYFGGILTFGELLMVSGAFLQVQNATRWFVENFARIADWRATLLRVMVFRLALPTVGPMAGRAGRIEVAPHPDGHLALEALSVALPDKKVSPLERSLVLAPGDRLVVTGGAGSGKSMLFRAIAGLWPWGSGRVLLPPAQDMMFLPQRPYLPMGSLRQVVSYPTPAEKVSDGDIRMALERVGLRHLAPMLDEVRRWDKELPLDEQQCLAFARLLLRRPKWVVMDDPLTAVDPARQGDLCRIFDRELPGTAVLAIGRSPAMAPVGCRLAALSSTPGEAAA